LGEKETIGPAEQEPLKSSLEQAREPPVEIRLSQLSSRHYGRPVRVKCQIIGQGDIKNFPRHAKVSCPKQDCAGNTEDMDLDLSSVENFKLLRDYLFEEREFKESLLRCGKESFRCGNIHVGKFPCSQNPSLHVELDESGDRGDYVHIYVRDLLGDEKFTETTYRPIWIYLIDKPAPQTKKVEIEGIVIDDKDRNLTILAYDIRPIEEESEAAQFSQEELEGFRTHFREDLNLGDLDQSIQPKIVGRRMAKIAAALTLHSPLLISFEGGLIRGCLHTMFVGDTTTGKSEIQMWIHERLRLGEFGVGETGSRAGVLYAVDTDANAIIWGLLPLADKGLALIDGLQGMNPKEIPLFREALRSQRITVRMKVSGEALCRTRIIANANASRSLSEYAELAEALIDIRSITDPVDLTRWDLFIPFHEKDVSRKEIANSQCSEPKIPDKVFTRHVLWAWTKKPEDIEFEQEALEAVRETFKEVTEFSYSGLPLVHNGYKELIARVAVSFAILHHSSPDHQKIVVTRKHVEEAKAFIQEMLDKWEYCDLVVRTEKLAELTYDEEENIRDELSNEFLLRQVFDEICNNQGITASALANKLKVDKRTIISKTGILKGLWLIEAQERRSGYWLSKKGITYYRRTRTPPVKAGELVKSGEGSEVPTAREVVQSTHEKGQYQVLKLISALNAKSFVSILEKIIRAWK